MYCTHFISIIFKKKERERKREKLSFCWPKFLGGKTSIVALLKLPFIKKRISSC
jgi:hypothetical protein